MEKRDFVGSVMMVKRIIVVAFGTLLVLSACGEETPSSSGSIEQTQTAFLQNQIALEATQAAVLDLLATQTVIANQPIGQTQSALDLNATQTLSAVDQIVRTQTALEATQAAVQVLQTTETAIADQQFRQTRSAMEATRSVLQATQAVLDLHATETAIAVQQTVVASTQVAETRLQTDTARDQATLTAVAQSLIILPTPFMETVEGIEMVFVPAGCFLMGSDRGTFMERPVHEICFQEPFWIGRYEVTNGQYGSSGHYQGDNHPRDSVSWYDARDFCEARGMRLPTEAEWEYAAKGPKNWVYPWGNEFIGENVIYSDTPGSGTWEVGSTPGGVSWVGAFDMAGNVMEWVSSRQFSYPYNAADGRENDDGRGRQLRGGSFAEESDHLRTSDRFYTWLPTATERAGGFRCARSN